MNVEVLILISILVFIIGAAVGSFLNVVIFRLPKGEEIFRKRSNCPNCKTQLKALELIPIFSYFLLAGKCRNCGKPISIQYPAVEAISGILFLASFIFWQEQFGLNFQFLPHLVHLFLIVSVLILVFAIDFKLGIIPDQIVKFAILGSVILIFASYVLDFSSTYLATTINSGDFGKYFLKPLLLNQIKFALSDFGTRLATAIGVTSFFGILILVTGGRGMGWGDAKFGFWLGLVFSLPAIFLVLFLSFVLGAAFSIILILTGRKKFGQTVPLGPFLATGSLISLFAGDVILKWYLASLI